MLVYIWMCVMMQAFMPGGDRIAALHAGAFEAHLRAGIERPAAVTGAAAQAARHAALAARAR